MILQAESKREYEEVSVKESIQTAVFSLPLINLHPHLKDIYWNEYLSWNDGGAVNTHLCGFHIWFVLGHNCHSWYQSLRQLVSELAEALMWISAFLSQWICTVNNISRQIYLTDNPEVTTSPSKCHTCTNTAR